MKYVGQHSKTTGQKAVKYSAPQNLFLLGYIGPSHNTMY